MKNIKITMLGLKGSGKTCYMLAMYAIMSAGVDTNGLTLSSQDDDQDLDLEEKWENLLYNEGEQRWPAANNIGDEIYYHFNFNYAGTTRLMSFDWLDYRGGALKDRSNQEDVRKLSERIKSSSCLFLCVPGTLLAEKANDTTMREAGIKRMKQLYQKIGTSGQTIPIVILITKSDTCSHRPRKEIFADLNRMFEDLFITGKNWQVMICPVTLGDSLSGNINYGLIQPKNVHLPLVFSIYFEYLNASLELENKQDSIRSEIEQSQQTLYKIKNRNLFSKTWDGLRGIDKTFEVSHDIEDLSEEQEEIKKQMDNIQNKLNLLMSSLNNDDISIYISGKEVEINV